MPDRNMNLELIEQKPKGASHAVPLLFVHGAWHGAWCWEKNFLPYFAANGYASYAVSLRGHGNSDVPAHFRLMRIADYVSDVVQTVDRLPAKPVMIGHSMGGLVVQKYLEVHTAPAAVLLAPVPVKGVLKTTVGIACRHPLVFLRANLTWRLYPIVGKPHLAREAFFSKDIAPEKLTSYFDRLQDESYLAFLDMLIFAMPQPGRITTDVLIMGAENDTIFRPDEIEMTAAAYGQKPQMFKGMAHDMMLEDGWQAVADRILEWLAHKRL
jgi:pimeloyl-ACP methyl ester carboxylesterase